MTNQSRLMQSANGFAEQWPYLRYLGMGAWWGWIWLCYNSVELVRSLPVEQHPWYVMVMYMGSTPGIAAVMLLAAIFWKKFTPLIENNRVVVAFGIIAGVATALMGYCQYLGGTVLFTIASVFTGIGTSFLCLKAGHVYGSVAMRESLTAGAVSLLFASFLYYMGIGVPQSWRIVFIALLPVVSAFLFIMPGDDPFPAGAAASAERLGAGAPGRRTYRHLVAASALVAFTAGVGKGLSSATLTIDQFTHIGTVTTFAIAVVAVLIGLAVNGRSLVDGVKRVYSALMLLGVAMLLASCIGLNLAYMSIGKEALWMLFSCIMAYIVFRFDFSPVRAFGIGQAIYFLTSTAAWGIGAFLATNGINSTMQMAIALLFSFLVVLILTFVFTESDLKFILSWHAGDDQESHADDKSVPVAQPDDEGPASPLSLHESIERIDPSLGLSSRETQILELFAQGRSANWIADDLTISKNTVRSHLRSIYTKLNVHTRQELLDFLRTIR